MAVAAVGLGGWAGLCAAETVFADRAHENAPWKLTGETVYVSSNRAARFMAKASIDLAGETLDVRLGEPWENVWMNDTTVTNSSDRPARFRFHSPHGKLHVVTREWRGGPGNVLDASHGRLYLRTKIDPEDCWSLRLGAEGGETVMGGSVTGPDSSRYLWAGPVEFAGDVTFADDTNAKAGGWGLRLTGPLSGSGDATVTLARAFALQISSRENTVAGSYTPVVENGRATTWETTVPVAFAAGAQVTIPAGTSRKGVHTLITTTGGITGTPGVTGLDRFWEVRVEGNSLVVEHASGMVIFVK